jgi:hypothetical protein
MGNKYIRIQRGFLCLLLSFFTTCASTGSGPQPLLFSEHTLTLYSTGSISWKEGSACAYSILGLIAWGDATISTAQEHAYVSKINTIDQRSFTILGIYAKLCTIIKGV